ncbi:DUF2157 domain-containing protein [Woodsholea maritima]|uniref:DUF2157 domain-containing protein n=1 Tax=Woodsholea maritima TaxID=240237 RepID=UPI000369999B|nr:DUF2157 domain-containing protein [Woodsholea maritima]
MRNVFRGRLDQDLDRWIEAGWVPEDSRKAILDDARARRANWSARDAGLVLGIVLLAMSALTFVAANWADMARIWKFALILITLLSAYTGAGLAFWRGSRGLGHSLALLGALLFGAGIALTAQTFNMADFRNTGVLIWAGIALATAIFTPSRPVLIAFTVISGFWLSLEINSPYAPDLLWMYLGLWVIGWASASAMRSKVSLNLLALTGLGWLSYMMMTLVDLKLLTQIESLSLFALITLTLALIARFWSGRGVYGMGLAHAWFTLAAVIMGFILKVNVLDNAGQRVNVDDTTLGLIDQITLGQSAFWLPAFIALLLGAVHVGLDYGIKRLSLFNTAALALVMASFIMAPALSETLAHANWALAISIALSALVLSLAVTMIISGAEADQKLIGIVGIGLFIAEVSYIYYELFGDLLNTALFFFLGGALILALVLSLPLLRKALVKSSPETEARS